MRIITALALLLLTALPAAAADDLAASIAEGKRLATINCARCHNLEAAGESPLTDAPPFRDVAKDYDREELIDSFMEGLAVRHPLMPDWDVTEPQATALTDFVLSLGNGQAKTADDAVSQGIELLRANCARCHAIDATSLSPEPKAPPFRDVVKKYDPDALEEALAEGIVTGHNNMPEFAFDPDQVTAIIAYLDTLKAQ
ncbi:c-type cytochrome [Aestuariivirga sp.]|uniref:c-type cytochrome n=1 Tax=Aestuariivirga sp. TaxID=2650926 RepID=UPI003BAAAA4A